MSAPGFYSAELVTAMLAEARDTLRAMSARDVRPAGYGAGWPELTSRGNCPARPTPAAITRMDHVLRWPAEHIPASRMQERRAVLRRADRLPWRRIGEELGLMSHEGARKVHHAGVTRIAAALNYQQRAGALRPTAMTAIAVGG